MQTTCAAMAHLVEHIPLLSDPGPIPAWVICAMSFPPLSPCFLHCHEKNVQIIFIFLISVLIIILQSKLLKKARSLLMAESKEKNHAKERAVNESFPPLQLSGLTVQELQV